MQKRELVMGDILKSEADPNSREAIAAEPTVKIGDVVNYPSRKQPLIALSNAEQGQVLVQPWNCTINLDVIALSKITGFMMQSNLGLAESGMDSSDPTYLNLEELKAQGDTYGIKYIGEPIADSD